MKRWREALTWAAILTALAIVLHATRTLTSPFPTHFTAAGRPNRYAGPGSLWMLFALDVLLYLFVLAITRIPHLFNLPAARNAPDRPRQEAIALHMLGWMRLEIACLFALILQGIVQVAEGHLTGLDIWMTPVAVVVVLATLGSSLWRMIRSEPPMTHPIH